MAEHNTFVNSCCPLRRGPPLVVSGSDDCSAKVRMSQNPMLACIHQLPNRCSRDDMSSGMSGKYSAAYAACAECAHAAQAGWLFSADACEMIVASDMKAHALQLWDLRSKRSIKTFTEKYQILAVAFADAGDQVCLIAPELPDMHVRMLCVTAAAAYCVLSQQAVCCLGSMQLPCLTLNPQACRCTQQVLRTRSMPGTCARRASASPCQGTLTL